MVGVPCGAQIQERLEWLAEEIAEPVGRACCGAPSCGDLSSGGGSDMAQLWLTAWHLRALTGYLVIVSSGSVTRWPFAVMILCLAYLCETEGNGRFGDSRSGYWSGLFT